MLLLLRWAVTEKDALLIWNSVLTSSQTMLTASIRLQASAAEVRQGLLGLLGEAWQEFWKAHLGVMEALCLATRHSCMTSPETTPNPQIFLKIRRCPKIPQKFPLNSY